MLTTNRKNIWKLINNYERYKQVDEDLANEYVNQWVNVEENKWNEDVLTDIENKIKNKHCQHYKDEKCAIDTSKCWCKYYDKESGECKLYINSKFKCDGDKKKCIVEKVNYKNEKETICDYYIGGMEQKCLWKGKKVGCEGDRGYCGLEKPNEIFKPKRNFDNSEIEIEIKSFTVNEECPHYLQRTNVCLMYPGERECGGCRSRCEMTEKQKIQEIVVNLGIDYGKVNGYRVVDGEVVYKKEY